jgi:hypothetical protein
MPIRVDAYLNTGMAVGWLLDAAHLREALERGQPLELNRVTWQAMEDLAPTTLGTLALEPDDLIVVVGDDESIVPVHAVWHSVGLEAGVYRIEGELPTMPGFDPGRALTRPTGEFVLLRDVRVEITGRPDVGGVTVPHAFVNRYTVERVEADLMLGFFFPGAVVDTSRLPGPLDGVTTAGPEAAAADATDQEPAGPAASATPATPG